MSKEITLSYIKVGSSLGWDMMRLDSETYEQKRHALVDKVYELNDVDVEACPEAWRTGPLQRWCWLIVHLNELECDPEAPKPLVHWGIDVGFADADVREFVWAVA